MTDRQSANAARDQRDEAAWNQTARSYPLHVPLPDFLEQQAERSRDRIAVSFRAATLTYDQLNRRANQLAHHLIALGVGPDVMVGICVERSLEMVIGLLAILKAGGAYVPFDPEYPEERLAFMANDAAVAVLLSSRAIGERIRADGARRVDLYEDWPEIAKQREDNPARALSPKDLAYTIYTSGSTGKPKGAMNTHEGIVNRLLWMQEAYGLTPDDRVLQKTPFSFDVSVWEFFWPLMVGARLVMAEPGGHKDPAYLVRTIREEGITTLHFVPSMLSLFNRADGLEAITTLRRVFCSGEALPHEQVKRFFQRVDAKLFNLYGPTEAAVDVTSWECTKGAPGNVVPIGRPIANTRVRILSTELQPVPIGESGELHIGGVGLARGYWNRPELTREKFIPDPFGAPGDRLYKTGDLARYLADGNIEYLGRIDTQVKIRGLRIELGEIEAALLRHPAIREAVVIPSEGDLNEKRLLAYLVAGNERPPSTNELRAYLLRDQPDYMVPAAFVFIPKLPLSPNGKVDRKGFAAGPLPRPDLEQVFIAPKRPVEKALAAIWCELLNLAQVGVRDNFFDLGGNSLLALESIAALAQRDGITLPLVKMFQYPSIQAIADFLLKKEPDDASLEDLAERAAQKRRVGAGQIADDAVAIIGMSGRFPGAYDVDELWDNLVHGVESVTFFTKEQLGPGLDPEITGSPHYVFARGIIPDGDKFDAEFFGINPAEAKVTDPQQRVFLELAWTALENAGYAPATYDGLIGVYAGMGNNYYYSLNVSTHPDLLRMIGPFPVMVGNEKDHIATRVAYKLNLTGPAVSVHTACSTSLTAVDNAFFSLMTHQCDLALAGGISLQTPRYSGQLAEEGGVFARDGHCRPFDAAADGTMFSDGAGIVVLKRLSEAIRDRDTIYAVIKSTALNNDGSDKVSYLAPSVSGQRRVIATALARAGVSADTIGYIEAHGTATPIGDPIEVEALTQVFCRETDRKQFCGIGSIKSNLGHPTIAAGIASVIKVALSLKHEQLPATLHYERPNAKIDFENSPFYVVSKLTAWPRGATPRRAGVSSFGFGGTNGHAIMEEAPIERPASPGAERQLLVLSAKSKDALNRMSVNLAAKLDQDGDLSLADAAYTLTTGRTHLNHRRFVVASTPQEAVALLRAPIREACGERLVDRAAPEIVFLFPGQGSQYVNMGLALCRTYEVFREAVDACASILTPFLGCDLREILYPTTPDAAAAERLKNTRYQQPAVFTIEYALAKLWASWGIAPDAMIGHSIGEYVAATLASVFTLDDALELVAARGRLMSELPSGAMLSVRMSAAEIVKRLPLGVSLAASNAPDACVVAGEHAAIGQLQHQLEQEEISCKLLETSHAFHSEMMDPIVESFTALVARKARGPAQIPILSTLTSRWVTSGDMSDASYWGKHLRSPVRFAEAIRHVLENPDRVLLEVGPGAQTSSLARLQVSDPGALAPVASMATKGSCDGELTSILRALGDLWLSGTSISWGLFWGSEARGRIPLPSYPFARTRHWVDPATTPTRVQERVEAQRPDSHFAGSESPLPRPTAGTPAVALTPREALTRTLAQILESISGAELGSGLDTSRTFAEMGMDSLFLTQISYMVKKELDVQVSFRHLTEDANTLHKLADFVDRERPALRADTSGSRPRSEAPPSAASVAPDELPTSALQREIWEVARSGGADASCAFNESISIVLSGSGFDRPAIDRALAALVARHEALRCVFHSSGRTLRVLATVAVPASFSDLARSGARRDEIDARLRQLLKDDFTTAFDLEVGPLVRFHIVSLGPEEHVVALTAHLAICDMWSLDVLVRDLGPLYSAEVSGVPASLPSPDSYRAYAMEEQDFSKTDAHQTMRAYWRERLRDPVPPLELPLRPGRPSRRSFKGSRVDLPLDPSIVRSLSKLSGETGCSLYTVLLGGLELCLSQQGGNQRVLIGMPVAGQALSQHTQLVGNGLRYLPLVGRVDPAEPLVDFLSNLRTDIVTALENSRCWFSDIGQAVVPVSDSSRVPFIAVCLNISPQMEERDLGYHGLTVRHEVNPRYFETFELFINVVADKSDHLTFEFQYNADLFDESDIRRLQAALATIYSRIGGDARGTLVTYAPPIAAPHAKTRPESLPSGDHPAFFGEKGSLYGVCNIPKKRSGEVGVLVCYPIAREYMRAFWSCRLLANQLAAQGVPVFRFDYLGTGDSLGDTPDWNLDTWTDDILTAAEEFRQKANVREVSVVSLRLGAALTARALERGLAVRDAVLWDPVVSGREYLSTLESCHASLLEYQTSAFPFPTLGQLDVDPHELGGFRFEPSIRESIAHLALNAQAFARCTRLAICASDDRPEYRALEASLRSVHGDVSYRVVVTDNVGAWSDIQLWEAALLPSALLENIVAFLTEKKP
ncbi:MAG: amino acid adenylation domain-containing protein [Polyangiales bacterium]